MAKYVVKTDDDVFVDMIHLPAYLGFYDLEARSPQFFLCYVIADQHPIRDPDHPRKKWFLTRDEYPRDDFPNYCSGTAYVTNFATIANVLGRCRNDLGPLFNDDDLNPSLAQDPRFYQLIFTKDTANNQDDEIVTPISVTYSNITNIATLDFASLYPSIMQAWNLCYSTLISQGDLAKVDPEKYKKSENNHCFVHSNVRKGILPTILEELLSGKKNRDAE